MFLEALESVPYFLHWNTEPDRTLISDSTFDEYYFGNSIFRINRQWMGFWIRSDHSEINVNVLMLGHIHKYYKNVLALFWCCYRKMSRLTWKEKLSDGLCSPPASDELGKSCRSHSEASRSLAWAAYCLQPLFSSVSSSLLFLLGASMPVASPAEIDLSKLKMIIVFISNVNWVRKVRYSLTDKYLVMLELNME